MTLRNHILAEASKAMSAKALPRRGVVTAYDPDHYAAKVQIQPEGHETGFLPVATPWVGAGWGMFCPPSPGDEVDVHFQEGGKNAAYVMLRFYGAQKPPLSVPSGEFWLVHSSGSVLKLTNDGKAILNGHVEIDVTAPTINITASTVVNVTAPAINLGSAGETLRQMVTDQLVTLFNTHTHQNVQPGAGSSGVPNQTMGAGQLTTVVKAG